MAKSGAGSTKMPAKVVKSTRQTPVGSARNAELAANILVWVRERVVGNYRYFSDVMDEYDIPGFIGYGAYRATMRIGQTVYKVEHWDYEDTLSQNEQEFANAERMRANGIIGVPHVTLWDVDGEPVIAMPYFPVAGYESGKKDAVDREYVPVWAHWVEDLHGNNWRLDKRGRPFLTDLAGYR
jgi:hypothetical protein